MTLFPSYNLVKKKRIYKALFPSYNLSKENKTLFYESKIPNSGVRLQDRRC